MKNKFSFLCFIAVLCGINSFSQRKADVVVPFNDDIKQIVVNPYTGGIIVKENNEISSYNPETNKTDWTVNKNDIVHVSGVEKMQKVLTALQSIPNADNYFQSTDAVYMIPNTQYIQANIENRDVILDAVSGKVVFNSETAGYRLLSSNFIPDDNNFLLIGTDGKIVYAVLWSLASAGEVWKTDIGQTTSVLGALKGLLSFKNNSAEDKVAIGNGSVYTTFGGILYKLQLSDGQKLWASQDKINTFYLSGNGNDVIVIKRIGGLISSKRALNIWDGATGQAIWKDDIVTKYIIYLEDWGDKILVTYNSGFNFYSYADGKKIWKKDAKGDDIKQVIPVEQDDYLYIADKDMYLVDNNGKEKWKKSIEISDKSDDAVYFLGKVENNRVFYLTSSYGNMVDYASGKKIWKKNIEFDRDAPLIFAKDENSGTFMVYNDKKLYKFDPNATDKPEAFAKLKSIKDDKNMSDMELFDWGMVLTGQSDVIGVNTDGTTRYQNTYTEPGGGSRKLMKVGAGVLGTASAISQAQTVYAVRDKNGNLVEQSSNVFGNNVSAAGRQAGGLAAVLAKNSKRFNALKQNSQFAYVLNKGMEGAELVKVQKSDGKEVDRISLDNNKPIYDVDPVTAAIFYAYKNELRIFK